MSSTLNLGPLIAKVTRDMLDEQGSILDIESVYVRLIATYSDQVFESERILAQIAVRQKIKQHLKHAHSINGDGEGDQLSLLKDDAPATLAVKQADGSYAYVPLKMASLRDLDMVTKAKQDNIENVRASFDRWIDATGPIRVVMAAEGISFGEAQKRIAESPPPEDGRKTA